jgi:hypothetical protein
MTKRGKAINRAKDSALLVAKIFGIISPNSRRIKVITTTWTTNPIIGEWLKSMVALVMNADRITIPTLMKLLAIKMDASSCSGSASSLSITALVLVGLSSKYFKFTGLKEKNADSDPDTKLDNTSRINSTTMPKTIPQVIG